MANVSVWTEVETAGQYTTVNQAKAAAGDLPQHPSSDQHRAGGDVTPMCGADVASSFPVCWGSGSRNECIPSSLAGSWSRLASLGPGVASCKMFQVDISVI